MDDEIKGSELDAAYWINTHKRQLRLVTRLAGIGTVALIWLLFGGYLFVYLRNYQATERAQQLIGETLVNYESVQPPSPLLVKEAAALERQTDLIDVYALVSNPNPNHVARFRYTFTLAGQSYDFNDGWLMPNESGYLVMSPISGTGGSDVTVSLTDVTWQRVRGKRPIVQFEVTDQLLSTATIAQPKEESTTATATETPDIITPEDDNEDTSDTETTTQLITQLTAKVVNRSPYGFKTVRLIGILRGSSGQIIGIQQVIWSDVASFTSRPLQMYWPRRYSIDTKTEIIVATDWDDQTNLIYPTAD